jgi:uncharacterized protein (DUF433 family)
MTNLLDRITINPDQCGGRPCIRGMRIRVTDILDLYAAGSSAEQILEEMPDLEPEDLQAALSYAARKLDHPVLEEDEEDIDHLVPLHGPQLSQVEIEEIIAEMDRVAVELGAHWPEGVSALDALHDARG